MNTMKRTLTAAATAFALAWSTVAGAQGVKMTDEQLDQVTAAGSVSLVAISNPGNAGVAKLDFEGHSTCINCTQLFPAPHEGKTAGVVLVTNKKFNFANANPIIRCIGAGIAGLC